LKPVLNQRGYSLWGYISTTVFNTDPQATDDFKWSKVYFLAQCSVKFSICTKEFYHLILTLHCTGGMTQGTFLMRLYFLMYSYFKDKHDKSVRIVLIS